MYEPRFYRKHAAAKGLVSFEVKVLQTDLLISASKDLTEEATKRVVQIRSNLESYIQNDQVFLSTMAPYEVDESAPHIVKIMSEAASRVGVGPMASVAGAVAEFVGKNLLEQTDEVIVENGGDIFIKTDRQRKMTVYAGDSPLSEKFSILLKPDRMPIGICTSSGTVGHSTSFGRADALVVISENTALADAAATAFGNQVKTNEDIEPVINKVQQMKDIDAIVIIIGDKMGMWGDVEIKPT